MLKRVTEKRPGRLFNKNTAPCELVRGGIGGDACPMLEGQEEKSALMSEALNLSPSEWRP